MVQAVGTFCSRKCAKNACERFAGGSVAPLMKKRHAPKPSMQRRTSAPHPMPTFLRIALESATTRWYRFLWKPYRSVHRTKVHQLVDDLEIFQT